MDKFVSRLNRARNDKQEIEQKFKSKAGSGYVWSNKVTVPVEPKLSVNKKKIHR